MFSKPALFRSIPAAVPAAMLAAALLIAPPSFAAAPSRTAAQPAATPGGTLAAAQEELLRMASQAGVIFAGEVLSVTQRPSFTPAAGTVEIVFRVDQPIRGCGGQSTYTLREWAGLWTGGHQRYAPGQRMLILLHAPSASGLSSPVGGQDGVVPITGAAIAPGPADWSVAQAEPTVDLRWVQARLPRPATVSQESPEGRLHSFTGLAPGMQQSRDAFAVRRIPNPRSAAPAPNLIESPNTLPLPSTASNGITLRGILAVLAAWQAQQSHASH